MASFSSNAMMERLFLTISGLTTFSCEPEEEDPNDFVMLLWLLDEKEE